LLRLQWDPDSITLDSELAGWVFNTRLVAKPDRLIKHRGNAGLLALNETWDDAKTMDHAARWKNSKKVGLVPLLSTIRLVILANGHLSIDVLIFDDEAIYP
jgi:hypothetical protein